MVVADLSDIIFGGAICISVTPELPIWWQQELKPHDVTEKLLIFKCGQREKHQRF